MTRIKEHVPMSEPLKCNIIHVKTVVQELNKTWRDQHSPKNEIKRY